MALQLDKSKDILLKIYEYCKNTLKTNKIAQALTVITSYYILREFGYYFYRKYYRLPPGPNGYPLVGCFLNLAMDSQFAVKTAKKYGPVFWIPTITRGFLFIGSSSIIKQLFPQKEWLTRNDTRIEQLKHSNYKVLWSVGEQNTLPLISINGDNWAQRRKHAQAVKLRSIT